MNVVVVDDEYYARKALVKVLEKLEINLEVVADLETGRDAVEFLQTHPEVDTVITDIRMPEMDYSWQSTFIGSARLLTLSLKPDIRTLNMPARRCSIA